MDRSSTPGVAGGGVDVTVALGADLLRFSTPPSSTSPLPSAERAALGCDDDLLTLAPSREELFPSR